jgi:hypothetical protein
MQWLQLKSYAQAACEEAMCAHVQQYQIFSSRCKSGNAASEMLRIQDSSD